MNKTMLITAVLVLLAGCNEPGRYEELVAAIHDDIGNVIVAVEKSGAVQAKEAAELSENFEKTKVVSMAVAKKFDEMADKNEVIAYLEAGKAGADAAAPFIPQAHAVSGILSIALAVAGVIAKKNGDKAKRATTWAKKTEVAANEGMDAVEEIVRGIERFKHNGTDNSDAVGALKTALRETTSPATKTVIAEARN